jgi:CcmD family protein
MKKHYAFLIALLAIILVPISSFAQQIQATDESGQMAVVMRSNGKIYVVVGVLLIVLTGIFAYLISLDRKITKLEKEHS